MEELSMGYLRQHLGEVLDLVYYQQKQYCLKRKGKDVGVIIPIAYFEQIRKIAKEGLTDALEMSSSKGLGKNLSDEQVEEIAIKMVDEVRKEKVNKKK